MKFLLFSIGTRGDMEPFLAIGGILQKNGHEVICAFPDQFQSLAELSGLGFEPLGPEFPEITESQEAKTAFGGKRSWFFRFISTLKMFINIRKAMKTTTNREHEIIQEVKPDIVLHNALNRSAFIWGFTQGNHSILISAIPYMIHQVPDHPYIWFHRYNIPFINKFTYWMTNQGLAMLIQSGYRYLKIPGKPSRRKIIHSVLKRKMVFTISPSLFPRPLDWPENVQILGFQERSQKNSWSPSDNLEQFLRTHSKIIFITFGSITNPNPGEKTRVLLKVLEENQIPAVINTAAGGLSVPPEYNTRLFHFVSYIPYDFILPRMYAIIHHGGSGTTHTGLKYGCATMIIPHIFDQFAWNKMISDKGLGPKGMGITKMNEKNLEPKITDLFYNPAYKKNTEAISDRMLKENLEEELYRFIMDQSYSHLPPGLGREG